MHQLSCPAYSVTFTAFMSTLKGAPYSPLYFDWLTSVNFIIISFTISSLIFRIVNVTSDSMLDDDIKTNKRCA